MRTLKSIFFLFLILASCKKSPLVDASPPGQKNGCLVDAEIFNAAYNSQQGLKRYTYSKILVIKWDTFAVPNAHAGVVYVINTREVPNPKYDRLYYYDYVWGSQQIPIDLRDKPVFIARYIFRNKNVQTAYFLE